MVKFSWTFPFYRIEVRVPVFRGIIYFFADASVNIQVLIFACILFIIEERFRHLCNIVTFFKGKLIPYLFLKHTTLKSVRLFKREHFVYHFTRFSVHRFTRRFMPDFIHRFVEFELQSIVRFNLFSFLRGTQPGISLLHKPVSYFIPFRVLIIITGYYFLRICTSALSNGACRRQRYQSHVLYYEIEDFARRYAVSAFQSFP